MCVTGVKGVEGYLWNFQSSKWVRSTGENLNLGLMSEIGVEEGSPVELGF